MTVSTGNQPERRTKRKKIRNPFRGLVRSMVALHTMRVGEGAIDPEESVEKEITLANGAVYQISITRIEGSKDKTKGAWDFPPKAKKEKKAA